MSRGADLLTTWIVEALRELGGSGTPVEVARVIWERHEDDLRAAGDLFYTWQYDYRWAATLLRQSGVLRPAGEQRGGRWALAADEHRA